MNVHGPILMFTVTLAFVACQKSQETTELRDSTDGMLAQLTITPVAPCTDEPQKKLQMLGTQNRITLKIKRSCEYTARLDMGDPAADQKSIVRLRYSSAHPQREAPRISATQNSITIYPVGSTSQQMPQPFAPQFKDTTGPTVYDAMVETPAGKEFHPQLKPVFERSCTSCHHPTGVASTLALDRYPFGSVFLRDEAAVLRTILNHVDSEQPDMPPPGSFSPLTKDEVELVRNWSKAVEKS